MTEYDKLSLVELRIVAKKMGIKSVTSYKKLELLAKVKEVAATMESTDATPETDDIQSVDHVVESTGEAVDSPCQDPDMRVNQTIPVWRKVDEI